MSFTDDPYKGLLAISTLIVTIMNKEQLIDDRDRSRRSTETAEQREVREKDITKRAAEMPCFKQAERVVQ